MNLSSYTLDDLRRFDEYCAGEAEKMGLPLPTVNFNLVQAEEMYDIAARGLPGRYSHYQFGRAYQQQKQEYDKGRSRIYELVLNTRPVQAYLLDGNGLIAQLLVIAHVYGHAAIFENNKYFAPADKNILSRTRANAERIDRYIGEYGRRRVEDFIDICESLEYQRSYDQLSKPHKAKPPKWEDKPFDILFPDETEVRREDYLYEKEDFRIRFPQQPERDILAFIEQHARRLEDWQRDVISIIRSEVDYFVPQMLTQILNEAFAVYYHQNIVQKLMAENESFTTDQFTEFQAMNARVLHPNIRLVRDAEGNDFIECHDVNPYLTGSAIFREIKRICEAPTDEEKEHWSWAGDITWDEKRAELGETYDDAALLTEFLSPAVCEQAKLFERLRTREEYKKLRVLEAECDTVRDITVQRRRTLGVPPIDIVNADYLYKGELYMEHLHDGLGLDEEYTQGTMPNVVALWGHPVVVKTVARREDPDDELKPIWYRGSLSGKVSRHTVPPT